LGATVRKNMQSNNCGQVVFELALLSVLFPVSIMDINYFTYILQQLKRANVVGKSFCGVGYLWNSHRGVTGRCCPSCCRLINYVNILEPQLLTVPIIVPRGVIVGNGGGGTSDSNVADTTGIDTGRRRASSPCRCWKTSKLRRFRDIDAAEHEHVQDLVGKLSRVVSVQGEYALNYRHCPAVGSPNVLEFYGIQT
jgi:hypothetical protein